MKRMCAEPGCGRPAIFTVKGGKVIADDFHDLCQRHWRDAYNKECNNNLEVVEEKQRPPS